ncbi:hypothetical protein L6164_018864 [Bauhinia variegata]|uniref:Uncharacterized protein n=1 Tax=Bauhinia variegata TaxID=167791 RepID=A0ACB9NE89_BAUVA|nr:hypothetical protein L6164_018864 [Bauhinia variegata]
MDTLTLLLLLLLICYRVLAVKKYNFLWFVAFLCESWFTFLWVLVISSKWSPAVITTYPYRLLHWASEFELPPVDLFVTTADPVLEPPIIKVNTVLSLLAIDYPAHKLACYVSDDGCSPITFYALVEASKFAKIWVPFCKKYNVQTRAPIRYFSKETIADSEDLPEFRKEWLKLNNEYEHLSRRIEDEDQNSIPCQLDGEFSVFLNTDRRNHSTIIKAIWENKKGLSDDLPHLIYISREKLPGHPHYHKAGAMNVLTRVSGLMTNAPFMLNVDCDMLVNNPKIVLHALCILLDFMGEKEIAFVQCFQEFYDGLKDDPFANQNVVAYKYMVLGISGLQGPFYMGTNCMHRRRVIYGLSPDDIEKGIKGKSLDHELFQKFGNSKGLVKSVAHAFEGKKHNHNDIYPTDSLEAAREVADCEYECGTGWGKQVGWLYGSTTEDLLTGLNIHARGWRSETCRPDPIAFTGCTPPDFPATLTQRKRWGSGLLEIFLSKHSPILCTLSGKLHIRQRLIYIWVTTLSLRSVPEICYAALPTYCIINNSTIFPKDLGLWIPVGLFVTYNILTLSAYLATGLSIREWWNNERMSRFMSMNAYFMSCLSVMFKFLRISEAVFEITQKEHTSSGDEDGGRFTFNKSPMFIPGTTILMVQLTALVIFLLGLQPAAKKGNGSGLGVGEVLCSIYLVVCHWPFLKGLFAKGKYGIPITTICKSAALALSFVHLCRARATI